MTTVEFGPVLTINYQHAADVKAATQYGMQAPRGPVSRGVTEELFRNRDELMEAACWAALCGREVPDAHDSVVRSAVLLYHRFAYNFVDREKDPSKRPRKAAASAATQNEAAASVFLEHSESFHKEQKIRELTDKWRQMGSDVASEKLVFLVRHVLDAEEDSIDKPFADDMLPPLLAWPPAWKHPAQFEDALQRLKRRL